MDIDTIEATAVSAVKTAILQADYFKPVFNDNDTLPSWDGEIIVYKSANKKKDNIVDVIPVQIKGTTIDKRNGEKFRYSVGRSDLKNYLACKSGTILYFVVFIEEGENEYITTIYYQKLLPYDLKRILSICKEQDSTTLEFVRFPRNKKDITCLLYNVVSDMKKQKPCIDAEELTVEALYKETSVPTFTLSRIFNKKEGAPSLFAFLGEDYYFYTSRQDKVLQPVMHGRIEGIGFPVHQSVSINGIEYYPMYECLEYRDCIVLKIGEAIEFVIQRNDSSEMKLRIQPSYRLSEIIRDISFLLDLFKYKSLLLGEFVLPCDLTANSKNAINIESLGQHLKTYQMIQTLMRAMDVTRDFDLTKLKDEEWERLCQLYGSIIKGDKVKIEIETSYCVIELALGNLKILLFAIADKQTRYCYEMRSFSNTDNIVTREDGHQTTPFVDLGEEQILHVDNIRYENLFMQLKNIPLSRCYIKEITCLLFKMLIAYDKSEVKSLDILNHAINLAEWLEEHDPYSDRVYRRLNKMDAIKRSRQLNESENEELFSFAENTELPAIYRSFSYFLLGEEKSAERFLRQVHNNVTSAEQSYPIFRLWQGDWGYFLNLQHRRLIAGLHHIDQK